MANDVVVRVTCDGLIVRPLNVHRSITGLAASFTIRATVVVEHQVPDNHRLATVVHRA